MPDELAGNMIANIVSDPNKKRHLTNWIGNKLILSNDLNAQNQVAQLAIAAIDAELERRK